MKRAEIERGEAHLHRELVRAQAGIGRSEHAVLDGREFVELGGELGKAIVAFRICERKGRHGREREKQRRDEDSLG